MSDSQFNRAGAIILGERPRAPQLVDGVAARAMYDAFFGPEAKAAEERRRVNALRKACGLEVTEDEGFITVRQIHAVIDAIDGAATT